MNESVNIIIPENIKFIMKKLKESNYESYVVGGCVRDSLLGKEPKDWDLTTNAKPKEIKEVFKDLEIINNNGEKHGTVTVRYNDENIEITTYRIDGEYTDNRHPDKVEFTTDIVKDLARRDFTINAIAYDGEKLVDPFGGIGDLDYGFIRAVGYADDRFKEDALRILRGIRFACRYNFDIDFNTLKAMYDKRNLLLNISAERIQSELNEIMCYGERFAKLLPLYLNEVLFTIIPELEKINIGRLKLLENGNNKRLINIARLFEELDMSTRNDILKRLKYSNEDSYLIIFYNSYFIVSLNTKPQIKLLLNELTLKGYLENEAYNIIVSLIEMQYSDSSPVIINNIDYKNKALKALDEVINNKECYSLKQLKIDGNDLVKLGYKGKQIGYALDFILSSVIFDNLENKKEILAEHIKQIKQNYENN